MTGRNTGPILSSGTENRSTESVQLPTSEPKLRDGYPTDALLTKAELLAILRNFATCRGPRRFTTEEAEKVVAWAHAARVDATLLALVLEDRIGVDLHESGEILLVPKEGRHAAR